MKSLSPKITKLYVEKGRTTQTDREHWDKVTYGIEADVSDAPDEEAIEKHRMHLAMKIDDWLGAAPTVAPVDVDDIPRIDIAELDDCGWQTYQKQPAKPDQAAWIKNPVEFTSWQDSPKVLSQLVKALRLTLDQKLVLGDMEYSFSGKGDVKDHFISRKPKK